MKAIPAIIAFVVGVVLTVVACKVLDSAREERRRVQLRSDVQYPLGQCLDDIVKTFDRGDALLAQRKVRLLQVRWSEYLRGGHSPEQFTSDVTELAPASTAPAR
jgi:hypothetical protein